MTIPHGSFVMALLGSANRDESYFGPDADEFRLDRENARQHVSFGGGPHHCLGASLARTEAAIAVGQLTSRFPSLALNGEPARNGRINLRGWPACRCHWASHGGDGHRGGVAATPLPVTP